jgi:hypothetical protein
MRAKLAAKRAAQVVEEATERVVAARPSPPSSPQATGDLAQGHEVKRLRDGGMSWMAIGAQLGLPGSKSGAGAARRLYAAVNRGEVPRTQAPRKGTTPKPTGPASKGVPAYLRKEALVRDGHVIPRDMPDEEVEALVVGRRIEWAIDLAKLTNTDPATWGPEDRRWVPQDAKVHVSPQWVRVVRDEDTDDRVLYFREYGGRDDRGQHMSGPTRVVRVDSIYTVA